MSRVARDPAVPRLLRVPEVAARLSVGRRKVWLLLKSGELRSTRIGRSVRVDEHDVLAFIAACKS